MLSERDFSELSNSLAAGFELDKIVRTLAHIVSTRSIRLEDRTRLTVAKDLLDQIRRGERWLDRGNFDEHSAQDALAFDRAAGALPIEPLTTEEFNRAISRLETIIDSLLAGRLPGDEDIGEARSFYGRLARRTLQESHRIASGPAHGQWPTVTAWTQSRGGGAT
jgi:hypothetical protein